MQRGHAVVTALAHPQRKPSQSRAQCAWLTRAFRRRVPIKGWPLLFTASIRCALLWPNTTLKGAIELIFIFYSAEWP